MARYMTIIRWTPEQIVELGKRIRAITERTAPQGILDANAKMKNNTIAYSPNNNFLVTIYEVDEKDSVEATLAATYLSDTCTMETYPVLNQADSLKLGEMSRKIFPERQ